MSGDLLWDNVVFLCGFESAAGTDDYIDESDYAHPITSFFNAPNADTSVFKFGTSSAYFDGVNYVLQTPNHPAFDFGDEDFTIEAWIRKPGSTVLGDVICSLWRNGTGQQSWLFGIDTSDELYFAYSTDGSDSFVLSEPMPGYSDNFWYHVAVARHGDTIRLYFNKNFLGKQTFTGAIHFSDYVFRIGNVGNEVAGTLAWIDEMRITKGAARYINETTIDVPDDPFPRGPVGAGSPIPGAEEPIVTLAAFFKLELADRSVRMCDGGQLIYLTERYQAVDDVFGAVMSFDAIEGGFGDQAESVQLQLAPNPEAELADWWNLNLFDRRMRIWLGNVDADGVTVSNATLVADLLVDTYERRQAPAGEDLLSIDLMGRAEKLFLRNEGNVCSQRFHQSVWPGEAGFNNCTDLVGYLAWGAASPPRGATSGSGFTSGISFRIS